MKFHHDDFVGKGKPWPQCPPGVYPGVCVDVVELYDVATQYGPKDQIKLVFQLDERIDEASAHAVGRPDVVGKRYVVSRKYTASMSEKANLRKELVSWRGRDFTKEDIARGFDTESLVGKQALVNVVHFTGSQGDSIATVDRVMPPGRNQEELEPEDWTRAKDRDSGGFSAPPPRSVPTPDDDDDIPF